MAYRLTRPLGSRATPHVRAATLTGYDPATGETIPEINIFDRLPNGTRIGVTAHGTQVTLIRCSVSGRTAQIRTAEGVRGFISSNFIQEFRGPDGQLPFG